jgi:hypothetical protein
MDRLLITGSWGLIQRKLKAQFADLTNEDLQYSEGKEHEFLARLQRKLGLSKREIISIFEHL